jgi:hypothetical protein
MVHSRHAVDGVNAADIAGTAAATAAAAAVGLHVPKFVDSVQAAAQALAS